MTGAFQPANRKGVLLYDFFSNNSQRSESGGKKDLNKELNIFDYGVVPDTEGLPGLPARVTAQHKERYEIICPRGFAYARLKAKEYYAGGELFPTVGDYVMIDFIENGDSRILASPARSR